jgi:hypothetical protein
MMPEPQPLSSVTPLAAIERPTCPKCQAQMMLARIMPAFLGTDLDMFECTVCITSLRRSARMTTGAAPRSPDRRGSANCPGSGQSPTPIHSRHMVSKAAMITGPRKRPSNPNDCMPPIIPINTTRNGIRTALPISTG